MLESGVMSAFLDRHVPDLQARELLGFALRAMYARHDFDASGKVSLARTPPAEFGAVLTHLHYAVLAQQDAEGRRDREMEVNRTFYDRCPIDVGRKPRKGSR